MKKGTFYRVKVRANDKFDEKCEGYLYTVSDGYVTVELAIAKKQCGNGSYWDITHTGTGYLVNNQTFKSRTAAILSLTDQYAKMIINKLCQPWAQDAAERLAAYIEQQNET